jgi:DNA recombination protein RmuC
MDILLLIIGLAIGASFVFFITKKQVSNSKNTEAELDHLKQENNKLSSSINEWTQKHAVVQSQLEAEQRNNADLKNKELNLNNELIELNKVLSTYQANNKNLETKLSEQKLELEELNKKFTTEFENIANRLFEKSSEKINKQGSEKLDTILKPFKEKLGELKTQINETYEKDTKQRIRLHEQVKQLFDLNQQISSDAQNLTNALKSNSKVQGDWGEEILENILQQSGLRKGFEYDTQSSFTNEEGKMLRPDMIVHYPDQRDIIIDSKVSLTDYERYISAENIVEKEQHLKAHLNSIKQHIKELTEKNYQDIYQIETLDFVMMFVPIEGAYYIAIEEDRTLWQYSYEKKILLINPTNLITALKMISNLWQQDYQNKNVMEIARQSGGLYDSFVLLLQDFSKMEKKISETQEVFENVQKRISTGKGNLISRVEKIKTLGAKAKKSIPDKYQNLIEE